MVSKCIEGNSFLSKITQRFLLFYSGIQTHWWLYHILPVALTNMNQFNFRESFDLVSFHR